MLLKSLFNHIVLCALLFTFQHVQAQNWDLFPYGQKSFYIYEDTDRLAIIYADSVEADIGSTVYRLNTNADVRSLISCYDETFDEYINYGGYSAELPLYVTVTDDSTICFWTDPLDSTFVFYPKLPVGASWTIYNDYPAADFEHVTISCDSASILNIFGTTDSVKYYSLSVDDTLTGDFTIDKLTLVLSKAHGFIEYAGFNILLVPNNCSDCYKPFRMSGYIASGDTSGITLPKWSDFIQLQPGDFLRYHHFSSTQYGNTSSYTSVTIDSVRKSADSVEVFSSNLFGSGKTVYYRDALQLFLEGNPGFFYPGPLDIDEHQAIWDQNKSIVNSDYIDIDTNQYPGKMIFGKNVFSAWFLDTMFCTLMPLFEADFGYRINAYVGWTSRSYGDPLSYTYSVLVGSILSGHPWGETWPAAIYESDNTEVIPIYPNPTSDLVHIETNYDKPFSYAILTTSGIRIRNGICAHAVLDLSDLPAGLYMIQLATDTESYIAKIVKK
ncbi:MAG: T9SS type A sorting domain-containing protein [Chitinophagales bacterium]